MPHSTFLPLVRELAGTYRAFEFFAGAHIRSLGLTLPQFDIIATLGNTSGMTPKELGEKTLITKGTLTGVVDRLAGKRLVRRIASPSDGRSQIIQLTRAGENLFRRIFPAHVAYLQQAFARLPQEDLAGMSASLARLRQSLIAAHKAGKAES